MTRTDMNARIEIEIYMEGDATITVETLKYDPEPREVPEYTPLFGRFFEQAVNEA